MANSQKNVVADSDVAASSGHKHETEHTNPKAKRSKIEKQTTLDEVVTVEKEEDDEGEKHDSKNEIDEEPTERSEVAHAESAVQPGKEKDMPSSILEKGIIYFFIRGRVNVEEPHGVNDIARSYIMLRPIEKDAILGKGLIGDAGNTRLLALPKKVLPTSGKDRFMTFVEKSGASFGEIKEQFLAGDTYETKTAGTRHTPEATPVGEGIYAITTTGRESHLVYMITLPEKLEEVQQELGLKEKGSFIMSTKNPKFPGPAGASLSEDPAFPKKISDEFRDLRWIPSQPEHLNYVNAQLLLIGESSGTERALKPSEDDVENGKEEPAKVMEKLEEEDSARMQQLPGDQSASIFADLQAHVEDYPKLQTTF